MKSAISTLLLGSAILLCAAATDEVAGTWQTVRVDPQPIAAYLPRFEFGISGNLLTGTARVEGWPGDAPISNGVIEGNQIKFTLVHELTYVRGYPNYPKHPKYECVGTVHGDEIDLIMTRVDASVPTKYTATVTRVKDSGAR